MPDAVVVGGGPNGLAAAITLARAGRSVQVLEANSTIGGGCRSAELTLPGFVHDVCAAVLPFAAASPFFRQLPLAARGLEWVNSPVPLAHPLDDGTAVVLHHSVEATAAGLGGDAAAYWRLMAPLVAGWQQISAHLLGPLSRLPRHPLALARFGLSAVLPARTLAERHFRGGPARALFAGLAAHMIRPLEQPLSASFGLLFGMSAHVVGWPFPRGGAQRLVDALTHHLGSLGGEVTTSFAVRSLDDLPQAQRLLFNLTPRQLERIAGRAFPDWYRGALKRYRYGPGVFKLDWALDGPIPWTARECSQAGTVHLGGSIEEIATAERQAAHGELPDRPFVLLAQPTLFDPSRAPAGKHTAWAYCHVPNGSTVDMTERVEAQIERFAPGFRQRILTRATRGPRDLERQNENDVGGDIAGGANHVLQLLARPTFYPPPYRTPVRQIYLCSASTPPGGGVHGLCGYWAAQAVMRDWPS